MFNKIKKQKLCFVGSLYDKTFDMFKKSRCIKCDSDIYFSQPSTNRHNNLKKNNDNWIVEFWRVRGFEIVKTALGISFSLHRKPEFENRGLGLDLTYLEQFVDEVVKRRDKKC